MRIAVRLLGAIMLLPGLAFAQSDPPPAVVSTSVERIAVVESVNLSERTVLLRGESGAQTGALATVRVGPQVRNLNLVKPGDRVVITVTEAIAASVARPEDGASPTASVEQALRAAPGERPAASLNEGRRIRVRVDAVDTLQNTVSFTEPDGDRRTVRVQNPRMQQFIRGLQPGEEVDVVYLENVSLRVVPAGG
ncbi:hypothetical protein [Falsiroseomonas sp. HW251]|uniref:hypothetical protein n=1 Tax=Falsiroseomonas sp. HW251 TaxID=3390998 RepID=UPI003D31E982